MFTSSDKPIAHTLINSSFRVIAGPSTDRAFFPKQCKTRPNCSHVATKDLRARSSEHIVSRHQVPQSKK